ncbi:SRPBCC domain-containing protein [Nocardia miyunensis]|uniref:SRPBCC domain-containing protein n=1 Tax=Nocardia miyunensis TaxID=282684 RepID=UPI000A708CF0|nr:SRPBCC domain-containing protein [Nocardia miyunensis]
MDGVECDWGRVLEWEPPHRLVVTWQINGHWQFDPDPARASEVEIRFAADDYGTTVTLEHRHPDRLVAGEAIARTITEQGGGWSTLLELFAKTAENSSTGGDPA